jgi:hypothetical protein
MSIPGNWIMALTPFAMAAFTAITKSNLSKSLAIDRMGSF